MKAKGGGGGGGGENVNWPQEYTWEPRQNAATECSCKPCLHPRYIFFRCIFEAIFPVVASAAPPSPAGRWATVVLCFQRWACDLAAAFFPAMRGACGNASFLARLWWRWGWRLETARLQLVSAATPLSCATMQASGSMH